MSVEGLNGDMDGFDEKAKEIAQRLRAAKNVSVVGHIDADGITAAAIASTALRRAGVPHEVRYAKKIDLDEISKVDADPAELVWLVDLGSGYLSMFQRKGLVITDHHVINTDAPATAKRKVTLFDYGEEDLHLNPHAFGFDGSNEISGSGTTYWVAKAMDPRNRDLAPIAIVGAVGDFQDSGKCRLVGLNHMIVADGKEEGNLDAYLDLRLFGRETRPLAKLLQFASDPILPDLSNNEEGCFSFLAGLGIALKRGERWRSWIDLEVDERRRVINALVDRLLDNKKVDEVHRLIGEVYVLTQEQKGTELHDSKEFATLLNSCGRYDNADVGLQVCVGDRDEKWEEALDNLRDHRSNLKKAIEHIKMECTLQRLVSIQYYEDGHSFAIRGVRDTVVGIVAGMILGSGEIPCDVPIFAFAETDLMDGEDRKIKVSGRGTRDLVEKGLDLAIAMRLASQKVGGTGGGHNIAAGATIPTGRELEFLLEADQVIGRQLHAFP
jgi:single-stranded-DNA-specific exonuclease